MYLHKTGVHILYSMYEVGQAEPTVKNVKTKQVNLDGEPGIDPTTQG
jgi:hypothetical protein